jgi:hypothetical protein
VHRVENGKGFYGFFLRELNIGICVNMFKQLGLGLEGCLVFMIG